MSSDGVYGDKMPTHADDFWPMDDPALASFAEDLRVLAGGPAPDPRPGLLAVMRQGVVDPVRTPQGRRKMLVKTAVGSLAAKIALGVGVAAASVTAAGAADVLPDPAQRVVSSVVDAVTPFGVPDPSTALQVVDETTTTSTSSTSSTSTTVAGGTSTTLPGTSTTLPGTGTGTDGAGEIRNHGACVSAIAQDKSGSGQHGKAVSEVARSDCGKTGTTVTTVAPSTTTTVGSNTSTTSVTSAQRGANSGPGNSGGSNRGSGNSGSGNNGNGGGNSGRN